MKRHLTVDGLAEMEALSREVAELRGELDRRRHDDDDRGRIDGISNALIGELDPAAILDRAERWAMAALGRRCTIVTEAPDDAGAVVLGHRQPSAWLLVEGVSLGASDDDAVREVAERIGRALDAARQMTALTNDMRTLERSLLPHALLPVPGLQLATRHVPAQGNHDLSGDFYDAVRTGDSVTLIVGDVQGKGVDAATLTSLARHTLRAGALGGQRPAEMLAHLNLALLYGQEEQLASGGNEILRFVTAVVARLDPSDDGVGTFDLTVARAGQPPPIIVRGDGRFEHVEPPGMLLGVCDGPEYAEASRQFAVGDTLVLYTDGVIEQRGGTTNALSEQHLGMLVRNRRGVIDADAIAQLIEDTVHLVAPEHGRDDVAILVACATTR